MDIYILDTNLFFNMESRMGFGEKTEEIITNMTKLIKQCKKNNIADFYMTPKIVEEIKSFFDNPEQEFLQTFFSTVTIKSPNLSEQSIGALVTAEIVEEARTRAYRGMKVAEEEIIHAGEQFMGKEQLGKKEFQMAVGQIIVKFRDRFRNATRTGFIDSIVDFELIMLAKECDGHLISSDEGLISWGRKIGVKEMNPSVFGKKIQESV